MKTRSSRVSFFDVMSNADEPQTAVPGLRRLSTKKKPRPSNFQRMQTEVPNEQTIKDDESSASMSLSDREDFDLPPGKLITKLSVGHRFGMLALHTMHLAQRFGLKERPQ